MSTGRAREEVVETLCAATVEELETNEPKSVSWSCQASSDRGYFVAAFERLKDGAPQKNRLTHEQLEKAFSAVRIAFQRQTDPTMIDAYEARTLEGATTATEINVPPPKGGVQVLGRLLSVTYDGTLQGQDALWEHKFSEGAQPMLTADEVGRLFLVGGRYRVDDVGIVDKTPPDLPGGFEAEDILETDSLADFGTSLEFGSLSDPEEIDWTFSEPVAEAAELGAPGAEMFGDPAEIRDARELGEFSKLFLDVVPNAQPEAIQSGLAAYERLHSALAPFTALEQAEASAAIFIFRGSATSYNAERMNAAVGRVTDSQITSDLSRGRQISEALTGAVFHPTPRGTIGSDQGKWVGDKADREAIRDAKAASVFGMVLNDVKPDQLALVIAEIGSLKTLKKSELAGLARLALGSAGGGKSWTSYTKAQLLDVLELETGAEANPAFSKAPPGEGGRFEACVRKMRRREGVYDPRGLCASIGRKKYGAKRMAAMAKRGRNNPYTSAERQRFGELGELASNPAHPFVLTQGEIDMIAYNIIPIYQQDLQRQVEKLEAYQESVEMSSRAAGMEALREYDARRDLIYQLQAQIEEAEDIAEKLDEMEGIGSNPLGFEEEELVIGVAPPRGARSLERRTREGGEESFPLKSDNPKQDGRWHLRKTKQFGTGYYIDAGDVFAKVIAYRPRKHPLTDKIAELYQRQHEQQLPKGTKYLSRVTHYTQGRFGERIDLRWNAHTTLAAAKKAAERAMKRVRSNPTVANAGLLAGAPTGRGGFTVDERLTNAGVLAMPGGARPNSFDLVDINAGLVDPPRGRRSLPRQP